MKLPSFPVFMYSDHGARIFYNQEEFDIAGDGWFDSPAKVTGQSNVPPVPYESDSPPPVTDTSKDPQLAGLEALTNKELRELGRNIGLKFVPRDNKKTMIQAIRESSNSQKGE